MQMFSFTSAKKKNNRNTELSMIQSDMWNALKVRKDSYVLLAVDTKEKMRLLIVSTKKPNWKRVKYVSISM